jgi:tetratricopeptide (TPR) repeat protein
MRPAEAQWQAGAGVRVLSTSRAVLIRYTRDGQTRRGSGLHIGGRYVLTADHCADGAGHVIVTNGGEHPATVYVRSGARDVDLAVLECPGLAEAEPLGCAVLGWDVPRTVRACRALGFPVWKRGPLLAQVDADIPAAEGVDPHAPPDCTPPMSVKITNQHIRGYRIPQGDLDQPGSPWAGMSGAVVVTAGDLLVGVIRGHSPAEGTESLTATRLAAITTLPEAIRAQFLAALQAPDPRHWPRLPRPEGDPPGATAGGRLVVGEIPREPPAFVARETTQRLADAASRSQVAVVCAVTGLRGIGKTQVAAAYARQCASEGWGLVGWVNAGTRDTLLAGLARIAGRLGVADPEGDSLESARRLREHLETRTGQSLLVFDNATDPDGLRPLLPATGTSQVVITSTDQSFADIGEPVSVAEFTRRESLAYLRQRTGRDDGDGADAVAQELGDLPLALAQAAATIRRQHLTYRQYLQRLRQVPVRASLGRAPGSDYPHATAAALLVSIQSAEDSDSTGLTGLLLRVLAVLSPGGVSPHLLDGLGRLLADGEAGAVDEALERCVTWSLLTWSVNGDAVIMHRLTGRVLRERDQASGLWAATLRAAADLLEPHLFDEQQAWVRREEGARLVAQVEALWQASSAAGTADPGLSLRQLQMRSWSVRQLRAAADLSRAISLGESTLADCERLLGADHPDTLASRNNLAGAYHSAGRSAEAIPLLIQAIAEQERVLGADHPHTLMSRNNLAYAYESAGRLAEAIRLYEQTLAHRERVLGADHPHTLMSRNNLASAYESAGRPAEAIPLFERTLADCEQALGADHPDTLASRNNLAYAYQSAGRLTEAVPLYEQTLAEQERVLGADHPHTLASRNNLAYACLSAGRLTEAVALYEQTLAGCERVLSHGHPLTLTVRRNLELARVTGGGGRTQRCYFCHEITERISDGDRVACSACGRPYLVTLAGRADALSSRPAGLVS